MTIVIRMPALSPTMEEGLLQKWLKKEGDAVRWGEVIAEIETDKTTMELEAEVDGVLGKIVVPEGSRVPVNETIAILLEEGETASALAGEAAGKAVSSARLGPKQPAPPAPPSAAEGPRGAAVTAPRLAVVEGQGPSAPPPGERRRIFASPLARRLAAEAGIDLRAVRGSGPRGRVVKNDVEAAIARGAPAAAEARVAPLPRPTSVPLAAPGGYTDVPHTQMRRIIARRLSESKTSIPHWYATIDCRIDELLRVRERLNERLGEGAKLSVNDFIVRAAALALREVPGVNASWTETATRVYGSVDIAVAVATERGLITPIVRDADRKGLAAISAEAKELVARARVGKLLPEEYQGGTFTVSNLGMYGVREFIAIINRPQAAILAVGAGEERPVVEDGKVAIRTVMTCSLSADHRIVDGVLGSAFLAAFKRLVEYPPAMLL